MPAFTFARIKALAECHRVLIPRNRKVLFFLLPLMFLDNNLGYCYLLLVTVVFSDPCLL